MACLQVQLTLYLNQGPHLSSQMTGTVGESDCPFHPYLNLCFSLIFSVIQTARLRHNLEQSEPLPRPPGGWACVCLLCGHLLLLPTLRDGEIALAEKVSHRFQTLDEKIVSPIFCFNAFYQVETGIYL